MSYKMVFFDIDGTILTKEGKIPKETKEAVERLKEKNIDVCIATGRPHSGSIKIGKELGIDSFITFNGSHVIYKGKEVFTHSIPDQIVERVIGESHKRDIPVLLNRFKGNYATNVDHPYVKEATVPLCFEPEPFANVITELSLDDITETYQMLLFCEKEKEVELEGLFNDLTLSRWHKYVTDIFLPNVNKSLGIQKLLEHLDICPTQSIAFGDEMNDKEMLSFVGMGVAMGNCNKELIPYSKNVTTSVEDAGIFNALKKLDLI